MKCIVVTGGPASGKTYLINKICEEYNCIVIPEIYSDSLPWIDDLSLFDRQKYIFETHIKLLSIAKEKDCQFIICDRGTMDGLAYMSEEEFKKIIPDSYKEEYDRYSMILFLESVVKYSQNQYYGLIDNRRKEKTEQAIALDNSILKAWEFHDNLIVIKAEKSFSSKIKKAMKVIYDFISR